MFSLPLKRLILSSKHQFQEKVSLQIVTCSMKITHVRYLSICDAARRRNDSTSDMSRQSYWENFYRTKHQREASEPYDWFFPYSIAKPFLLQHIHEQREIQAKRTTKKHPPPLQVMELGCGTSDLSAQLFVDEPNLHIHCIDFSEEAIEIMREKSIHILPETEHSPGIQFKHCDAANMPFPDSRFNIVYEKGTIDAVLKHEKDSTGCAVEVIQEVARVLDQKGVFLQFSDETPEMRLSILEDAKREVYQSQHKNFSVAFKDVGEFSGIEFFVYIMQLNDDNSR